MAKGRKTGGRQKGTTNADITDLRAMILAALGKVGGVEYLVKQARKKNPAPFLTLVGKTLPLQHVGNNGGPIDVKVTYR